MSQRVRIREVAGLDRRIPFEDGEVASDDLRPGQVSVGGVVLRRWNQAGLSEERVQAALGEHVIDVHELDVTRLRTPLEERLLRRLRHEPAEGERTRRGVAELVHRPKTNELAVE